MAMIASPKPRRTVLLVTNIPTPYRIPLFNELNSQLAAAGFAFKVVFAALGYPRRKWQIDMSQCSFLWEVLNCGRLPSRDPEKAVFTYSGLGRILHAEKDALVIVGGFSLATTRLWLRSFFRRTRYLIWSGAIADKRNPESPMQRWRLRRLVSRASGCVAYGTLARDYLVSLGAPPPSVSIAINSVDVQYFREVAARVRRESPDRPQSTKFIHVGELSVRKRVDLLLRAVAKLAPTRQDFVLQLVGSGPEEQRLRALAEELGITAKVEFLGFRQKAEIAEFLARADCFLFPTSFDIWGLVLVEAMASGSLCVSSINAGAAHDLIQEGVTGFAIDFADINSVADRMHWVLDHPDESRDVGRRAQGFLDGSLSLSLSAGGFARAVSESLAESD